MLPLLLLFAADYLSPEQSAKAMTLPKGFTARLVAGEPTLVKPIAMTTDEKGRLWVVESRSYPHWIRDGKPGKDRVLILTPRADGGHDVKVFLEGGTNLSGIAVGFGGVWLCASPNFIYVPMKDDRPAGEAKVLIDGWSLDAKHNVFNSLTWGPDGWLYGCNGILATSYLGKPGTAKKDRTAFNCGVWRYHPTRHVFEPYAWGTTNPWGLDFNSEGEMFITNCVIKHVFHVVPGAHFVRMYGEDLTPNTYQLIESCAEHIHWAGGNWTTSRGGKGDHGRAGGGHAHAGAMFYQGGLWPKEYRDKLFMCNLHGNRLNVDHIVRKGSGYVAKRADDFLFANDEWFRGLVVTAAPDGNVYVADWHDTGECHNYDKTHPSGRIYKIEFGKTKFAEVDLSKADDVELVALLHTENEWIARQALRLIHERARKGLTKAAGEYIRSGVNFELRMLWALFLSERRPDLDGVLSSLKSIKSWSNPAYRRWMVRFCFDRSWGRLKAGSAELLGDLASGERDASVRLAYASALQRLAHEDRWPLAAALAGRADDADDAYIAHLLWYGLEPAVAADPAKAAELLPKVKIPLVRRNIARRLAAMAE
ncbi:MAG: PVC-type heme-binding CxxCH protein [Gemmataceae bacterium]